MNLFAYTKTINNREKYDHIFLAGDWCLSGELKNIDKCKMTVLPFLWNNAEKTLNAQIRCQEIFDKTIIEFKDFFNNKFNLDNSVDFYKILIGNWLIHFIHQAYDKYCYALELQKIDEIETYCIPRENYKIPDDLNEFIFLLNHELFQLQLFSQVATRMNIKSVNVKTTFQDEDEKNNIISRFKNKISDTLHWCIYYYSIISNIFNKEVLIISNPYFKTNVLSNYLSLFFHSKGRIIFDFILSKKIKKFKELRFRKYKESIKRSKNIDEFIFEIALELLPKCYYENFKSYYSAVDKLYKPLISKKINIFTYQSHYNKTLFQYFIAKNRDRINFYTAQHGSSYGMDSIHSIEDFDRDIADKFFTFGWKEDEKTVPLPLPSIKYKKKITENILLLTTTRPFHVIRFHMGALSSINNIDHIENPRIFIKKIRYFNNLRIRYHNSDSQRRNNKSRIQSEFPDLKIDYNLSFYKSLFNSKLFVSDHLGTSFLESMQSNIPSVIFINKSCYSFRDKFNTYIKKLEERKILFYSSEAAANHINEVFENLDKWWYAEEIQQLRKEFCDQYALSSNNWAIRWLETLSK